MHDADSDTGRERETSGAVHSEASLRSLETQGQPTQGRDK